MSGYVGVMNFKKKERTVKRGWRGRDREIERGWERGLLVCVWV